MILRDNDPPGEHYGRDVARCIFAINPAAKVKIVLLPGLPEGGDIVEFVEARDVQAPEEIRAEVDALADAVPWLNASDIIGGPVFKTLSDVQPQAVRWLWPYRIPMGKLTMVVGNPGLGKSYLSLYIAAAVTRGLTWPDDDQSAAPIGDVILLSAEDGDDDTIRPRADAAAADVRRVHLLEGVTHIDPDTGRPSLSLFNLERDISNLEIGLRRWPATRIVIIDPVSAYCGKTDSHKNADVRALLAPLAAMAGKHGVSVLLVSHLNKAGGGKAVYRTTGSLAFPAAARAVWMVTEDRDDPDRRLLLPVKMNLCKSPGGLAYHIGDNNTLQWESGRVDLRADDACADVAKRPGPKAHKRDAAVEWLKKLLSPGALKSSDVKQAAADAGISWHVVRDAQSELGITPYQQHFGGPWYWKRFTAEYRPENS